MDSRETDPILDRQNQQGTSEKLTVKRKISSLVQFLAVLLILPVAVVAAENDFDNDFNNDRNDPRATNVQRAILPENGVNSLSYRVSRGQAMNIARSRYEGRVLSILLDNNTNNWRVRMDRDGTVFNVFVNAASGDVSATSD